MCVSHFKRESLFENRSIAFWCDHARRDAGACVRACVCVFVYTRNQDVQLQLLVFTNGPLIVSPIAAYLRRRRADESVPARCKPCGIPRAVPSFFSIHNKRHKTIHKLYITYMHSIPVSNIIIRTLSLDSNMRARWSAQGVPHRWWRTTHACVV